MKLLKTLLLSMLIFASFSALAMDDLGLQIKEKAELAASQFQERAAGQLDFSPESLAVIEDMLAEASDFYDELPSDQIETLVSLMGSYVLYVGYKEHGGQFYWSDEQNQPVLVVGEPDYKIAIMTFTKVKGRLSGDEADNIPFFYSGFSARVDSAVKGIDVLYL